MILFAVCLIVGCSKKNESIKLQEESASHTNAIETENMQEVLSEKKPVLEDTSTHMEQTVFQKYGYVSFEDWKKRNTGSASYIDGKTVFVSIYLEEPDYKWSIEDKQKAQSILKKGYDFVSETVRSYGKECNLVFDTSQHPDLAYTIVIDENIPAYVTTEKEYELDDKVDQWIQQVPTENILETYDCDSIAYLFFIAHEGCSYSSMHFIDDGAATWDECSMLYLRDLYSPTYDYETPAVYAHEMLHLFGAEDFYKEAEVFSEQTYAYLRENHSDDIMYDTYEIINGMYTTNHEGVTQKITSATAYLLGIGEDKELIEACPELEKYEKGCFAGSTYDRPF